MIKMKVKAILLGHWWEGSVLVTQNIFCCHIKKACIEKPPALQLVQNMAVKGFFRCERKSQ